MRFLLAALLAFGVAHAQPSLDRAAALRASDGVIGEPIGEHTLLDRAGRPLALSRYRGQPLLVSFVYTGCFQVCPATTRALHDAVRALQAELGTGRFQVVSIGFNQPADSPAAMRAFAAQHRIDAPDWEFLSPPAQTADALTRAFGFGVVQTPAGFDHVLAVTVVDAAGRIRAQVYGDRPDAERIGAPLRALLRNEEPPRSRWADFVDRVRVLCTVYDPETGRSRLAWGFILMIAGGVTFIVAMAAFFVSEWRLRRRLRGMALR
jgi:protein SCO1/2